MVERPASAFLLGTVLALIALYRHNGLAVALGTPLLLGMPFYRQGLRLALALAVACGLVWGVRGPLYRAVAARAPSSGTYQQVGTGSARGFFKTALAADHICAQMADGTLLTDEERDLLSGLYPLENGKWAYDQHGDGRIGQDMLQHWAKWEQKEDDLAALALRLFRRNPLASLRHVLWSASYLWCITGPSDANYYTVAFTHGESLKYQKLRDVTVGGQAADWVEPKVPLPGWVGWTFGHSWLFWRPAIYLYLIVLSVLIAMLRAASLRYGVFLIPILLQTGGLSLAAFTQEFRFQFPIYMIGLLYGGYFLFCIPRRKPT